MKKFKNYSDHLRLEKLKTHLDRTNKDLAEWILKNLDVTGSLDSEDEIVRIIKSVDSEKYYSKLPTMYFFDSPAEDVPDGLELVHFTKYPNKIISQGFRYGEPDYLKLGMSWGSKSKVPGFNYGFTLDDIFEKYGSIEKASDHWNGIPVYFKAPAIKDFHFGDEVDQVIFWGPSAYDIKL